MDAVQCDVASDTWTHWHSISWTDVHRVVGRLQIRIAKATKAGNWRLVKNLQRLLTQSTSAKALAVRRVTENRGHKTPGVDRVTWDTPEAKFTAIASLGNKKYKPLPLRRIHIPKSNGGSRPLGIPTMKDRASQALHLLSLDPVAETIGDTHSFGFRRERSTADAIEQVKNALSREHSPQWILEGDIKGCFDNISHEWLLQHVPMNKLVLRKWLKAGFYEGNALFPTKSGTPQGGIISPVLSNMALDGLQSALNGMFRTVREARAAKVNFIRYADDFIITASSKELLELKVKPLVKDFLNKRGLELSESKTLITHVSEGFDFLGWSVRKHGNMLARRPSKKNVKAFLEKIRTKLRELRTKRQTEVIYQLNLMIRGWANYHRSQMSSRTFAKCDHWIWESLWRWAKRRHPNKGDRWIKKRYFKIINGREWRFVEGNNMLLTLSGFTKQIHIKIRSDANPYDPNDEDYFAKRLAKRMKSSLAGRRKLIWIWNWQDGSCPKCGEKITRETGWHLHHVVRRVDGGSNNCSNLELLHPTCHVQHHVSESFISK